MITPHERIKYHMFSPDYETFWQFIKFGIVGWTNSILYIIVFNLFIMLTNQETTTALIGSSLAWFVSTTNSFYLNRKFSFRNMDINWRKSIVKFYTGYIFTSLVLYSILTYVQLELLGFAPFAVSIINVLVVGPVNFFIAKYWSFASPTTK